MELIKRDQLEAVVLPGRAIQKAVGKDAFSESGRITMGFARYSEEVGVMDPHHHAEEVCYIVDAKDGWVRSGPEKDRLGERISLEPGMVMHNPALEWHVFGFDEGGYVDIVFIYGQVDNIRPEEIEQKER